MRPVPFFEVCIPNSEHGVPISINRTHPASGYWDNPVKVVKPGDADLRFAGFFDWDELGWKDFEFCRVVIAGFPSQPHLVGRLALIAPQYVEVMFVPALSESPFVERMDSMARPSRFSPEVRERAVRLVREHGPEHPSQWAAIRSVAEKLGCRDETLRRWVRQAERDAGERSGLTTDERQRLKELERENRELKRANEILRKASAYFAQAELDRRAK